MWHKSACRTGCTARPAQLTEYKCTRKEAIREKRSILTVRTSPSLAYDLTTGTAGMYRRKNRLVGAVEAYNRSTQAITRIRALGQGSIPAIHVRGVSITTWHTFYPAFTERGKEL